LILDDCFSIKWLNLNDEILEIGPIFNRSKLPNDGTILLRLITENNLNKFVLKLKPSKLFTILTTTSTTTTSTSTKHINSIKIQVSSNQDIIRLQCISGNSKSILKKVN
jgi:hypothetical protein